MTDRGRRGPDGGPAAQRRPPPPPAPRRRRARGGGGSGPAPSRGRRGGGDGDRGGGGGALARRIDVIAPAGKLGLQVDSNPEGRSAIVIKVKEGSPLLGSVRRGDGIVAVDDEDVSDLTPVQISMLLGSKSGNAWRKITLLRPVAPDHEKSSSDGDTTSTAQTSRRSNASADGKSEAAPTPPARRRPSRDGAASLEKRRGSEGDACETDGEYSLCESDSEFDKQWEKAREEKARGKKVVALVLEEDGTYSVIGKPEAKGKVKAKTKAKARNGGGRRGRDRRPVRDAVSADRGPKGGGKGRLCQSDTDRLVPPPPPPRPAPLCKSDSDRYDGGLSEETCTTASSSKPSVDGAASRAAERGRVSPTGGSDFFHLEQAQQYLSATRARSRASSATLAATRHAPKSPMPPSSDRGQERSSSAVVVHRYPDKSADETSKASEVTNSSTAATRGRRASSEVVVDGRYAPNRRSSLRSSTSTAGSRRPRESAAVTRGRRSSSEAAVRKSSLRSSNNNIQQGESKSPTRGRLCESDTDRFDGGASYQTCDTERSRSKSVTFRYPETDEEASVKEVTFSIASRHAEPKSPSPPSTVLAKYAPGFTAPSNSEARNLLEGSDPSPQDQTAPARGRRASSAAAVNNRHGPKSPAPSSNSSSKTKRTESSSSQRAVARGRRPSSRSVSTDRFASQSSNDTNQEGFDSSALSCRGRRASSDVVGTESYAPKSPSPPSSAPSTSIIMLKEPALESSSQRQRADAQGRRRSTSASRRGRSRLSSSDTKLEQSGPWSKDAELERSSLSLPQDPAARRGRRASSEVRSVATLDASSSQRAFATAENNYSRKSSAPAQFPSSRSSSEVVLNRYERKPSAPSTGDEILDVLERLESFSTREGRSRANSPAPSSGTERRGSCSSYSATGRLSSNSSRQEGSRGRPRGRSGARDGGQSLEPLPAPIGDESERSGRRYASHSRERRSSLDYSNGTHQPRQGYDPRPDDGSWLVDTAGMFISEEDASDVTLATPLQDPPVAGSSRGQSGSGRMNLSTWSEKGGAEASNKQPTSSSRQRTRATSPAPAAAIAVATAAAPAETSNMMLTSSFEQRMRANSPARTARDDGLFELKQEDLKPGGIKIVLSKDSGSVRSNETEREGRKGNLKRLRSIASSFSRRAGRR